MKSYLNAEKLIANASQEQAQIQCPSIEEMTSVAESGRKSSAYSTVTNHIVECRHCFDLYRALRTAEGLRPAKATWPEKFSKFFGTTESPTEGETSIPASIVGLLSSTLSRPAISGAYRSAETMTRPVSLISPLTSNRALANLPERIEWSPIGDAEGYEVRLEECLNETCQNFREIADAYHVDGCTAELEIDGSELQQKRYRIVIRPNVTSGFSLEPAEAIYVFSILNSEESRSARWALQNAHNAPITSAIALFELGMYGDAERIAATWPIDADLDDYREQIIHAAAQQMNS